MLGFDYLARIMGVLEDSMEVLQKAVVKENRPYTYKLLSRHLDIHVNDAKKLMYTFYQKYQDIVEPTFIISGRLNNSTDLTIKITKDINDKDKFDQIEATQIYSISPKNIEIDELLSTVNAQIREIPVDAQKLAKWGLIKGPELVKIDQPVNNNKPTESSSSASTLPIGRPGVKNEEPSKAAPKKEKEFPNMGLRSAQILSRNRKEEDKPKARTATQPTFGASSKMAKTKQQSSVRSRTEPAKSTPGTIEVEDPELNDEEYSKKQKELKAEKDKKQKELESMFDDDDDDDDEDVFESTQKEPEVEEVKDVQKDSKPADDLEGIFDSSFSQTQSQAKKDTQKIENEVDEPEVVEAEVIPEEAPEPKEKEETTSYYDEDGYLVTKVVEKPKTKAKPKPKTRASETPPGSSAPAAKKAKTAKAVGSKQQTSLMSFFGKK